MGFFALPVDLQDLVIGFCFEIRYEELKCDLDIISEINRWELPPSIVCRNVQLRDASLTCVPPAETFCFQTPTFQHDAYPPSVGPAGFP